MQSKDDMTRHAMNSKSCCYHDCFGALGVLDNGMPGVEVLNKGTLEG